jgi:peptidoglycan/xylan/chitin deacetylase (PgdA/CDA1 family)
VLKPEEFERDLEHLLTVYTPLSLDEYLKGDGSVKGRRTMVLSFDDGLKGCYDYIAPLLLKKGVPAVFFLNNRFIDNRGLFYRYKLSLLIHQSKMDCRVREKLVGFLKISQEQLESSLRMIGWDQRALLDALASEAEMDYKSYLRAKPVYMSTEEIRDLLGWGFEIGAHSSEHMAFEDLDPDQMLEQVKSSVKDIKKRFGMESAYFSFPFTSDGVPREVIEGLLSGGTANALLGTAGLKQTGIRAYIQRIPMDKYFNEARDTLKTEYLYYLLKMPLGRNRLRY